MSKQPNADPRELVLERILNAPRDKVYEAWTTPSILKEWFCPRPWRVSRAELDVRPGGRMFIVMNGPNGEVHENPGVYLDVVPGRRLVSTDAFVSAWVPSGRAFMVADVSFEDAGPGKTKYRAVARHWTEEIRAEHEKMGFHEGWGMCADQLETIASGGRIP